MFCTLNCSSVMPLFKSYVFFFAYLHNHLDRHTRGLDEHWFRGGGERSHELSFVTECFTCYVHGTLSLSIQENFKSMSYFIELIQTNSNGLSSVTPLPLYMHRNCAHFSLTVPSTGCGIHPE